MSALTRDLQFEEEGNCHPSILSMNIYRWQPTRLPGPWDSIFYLKASNFKLSHKAQAPMIELYNALVRRGREICLSVHIHAPKKGLVGTQ